MLEAARSSTALLSRGYNPVQLSITHHFEQFLVTDPGRNPKASTSCPVISEGGLSSASDHCSTILRRNRRDRLAAHPHKASVRCRANSSAGNSDAPESSSVGLGRRWRRGRIVDGQPAIRPVLVPLTDSFNPQGKLRCKHSQPFQYHQGFDSWQFCRAKHRCAKNRPQREWERCFIVETSERLQHMLPNVSFLDLRSDSPLGCIAQ